MTIRNFSIVILTTSLLAFPYVVFAIGNIEGKHGPEQPATAERAEKTKLALLKERWEEKADSVRTLRRLEDADADEINDGDLGAAIKVLAAQVRQLNERVDRLENPTPRIHPAKSLQSQKLKMDMSFKKLMSIENELQQTLRDVQKLEEDVSTTQAELDAKKTEANRLKEQEDKLVDFLKKAG